MIAKLMLMSTLAILSLTNLTAAETIETVKNEHLLITFTTSKKISRNGTNPITIKIENIGKDTIQIENRLYLPGVYIELFEYSQADEIHKKYAYTKQGADILPDTSHHEINPTIYKIKKLEPKRFIEIKSDLSLLFDIYGGGSGACKIKIRVKYLLEGEGWRRDGHRYLRLEKIMGIDYFGEGSFLVIEGDNKGDIPTR